MKIALCSILLFCVMSVPAASAAGKLRVNDLQGTWAGTFGKEKGFVLLDFIDVGYTEGLVTGSIMIKLGRGSRPFMVNFMAGVDFLTFSNPFDPQRPSTIRRIKIKGKRLSGLWVEYCVGGNEVCLPKGVIIKMRRID